MSVESGGWMWLVNVSMSSPTFTATGHQVEPGGWLKLLWLFRQHTQSVLQKDGFKLVEGSYVRNWFCSDWLATLFRDTLTALPAESGTRTVAHSLFVIMMSAPLRTLRSRGQLES